MVTAVDPVFGSSVYGQLIAVLAPGVPFFDQLYVIGLPEVVAQLPTARRTEPPDEETVAVDPPLTVAAHPVGAPGDAFAATQV